jgi:D-alanyl-D-alanine dipeptidase
MAVAEYRPEVIQQVLPAPDEQAYRAQYGVEFVAPTDGQRSDFDELVVGLIQERQILHNLGEDEGIIPTKPAVVYHPTAFLAAPLTAEQTIAINNGETADVAKYAISVQAELAKVPIVESGEGMIHLPNLFAAAGVPAEFSDKPFDPACGDWAGQPRQFWAREGFAKRLLIMGKLLDSAGVELQFEDGFRPVGVQEGLFKRRVAWTKRDHPDWTEEQVITEAQSKTAVKPKLASHKGGAAADAMLVDQQTGKVLDFGHEYPAGGALVFPRTPFVTAEQWRNRQLLQVTAGLAGLTLYVGEDWHVSYGDNLASLDEHGNVTPGYAAKYGPIKDFDRTTGEITEIYNAEEADKVFDY